MICTIQLLLITTNAVYSTRRKKLHVQDAERLITPPPTLNFVMRLEKTLMQSLSDLSLVSCAIIINGMSRHLTLNFHLQSMPISGVS